MKRFLHDNGLSLVLFGFFAFSQLGLTLVGHRHHSHQQLQHGQPPVAYAEYLRSAELMEVTMENWESEFLQMFAYVFLTVFLFQRGSAESKKPGGTESVDRDPRGSRADPSAPWPVRRGGIALRLYENSLSLGLMALFLLSFALHAWAGARAFSEEELVHGGRAYGTMEYLATSRFWFESLQNWQSEFFSIGMMVVLSIWLRQRGSPESKPVDAPHFQTGTE